MMGFLFSLFLLEAGAQTQWKEILESRNVDQLLQAETNVRVSGELKKACEQEQKNQWFPENCLKMWNRDLLNVNSKESGENYKRLDKLCQDHVGQIVKMEVLQTFLMDLLLPRNCRKAMQRRREDLQYIQKRDSEPEI